MTHDHFDHSSVHQVTGAVQVDASQEGTGDNHAISALKFKILQEFLELNWHVLLSDVDIVTLQVYGHSLIRCNVFSVATVRCRHSCQRFARQLCIGLGQLV